MAKYIEDEVHIESLMDLKAEKELDELLWYDYGVAIILDYKEENNV